MFSAILFIKFIFIFTFLVIIYFSPDIIISYLSNTSIIINDFSGFFRVFDKLYVFFPLAFIYSHHKSKLFKNATLLLITTLIIFSFTVSLWAFYVVFLCIYYFSYRKLLYTSFFITLIFILFWHEMATGLHVLYELKTHSIDVKYQQYFWFFSHIHELYFGKGFGFEFEFSGFKGFLIENFYIYFYSIYGLFVFTIFIVFVAILPLFIYKSHTLKFKKIVYLTHFSILFNSISNPYLMSVPAFLPLVIIFMSYMTDKRVSINK
jgi:hypothetical protein